MNSVSQHMVRSMQLGGLVVVLVVALLVPRGVWAVAAGPECGIPLWVEACGVAIGWSASVGISPEDPNSYCAFCTVTETGVRIQQACCPLPGGTQPPTSPPLVEGGSCVRGSIIDVDNRTVGEAVPLVGTPFALTYFSDRVPGRVSSYRLDIPMEGSDPADVSAVRVTIAVAGRTIEQSGSGASGEVYRFVWDGLDASGNWTPGGVKASINVAETHPSGVTDYPLVFSSPVGTWNVLVDGLGGWTLSSHHFYDSATTRLHLGSGSSRAVLAERPAPGYPGSPGFRVAAEDGAEVYLFDIYGRHLQTLHGLTGQTLLTFAYDARGRLTAVTDPYGNTTTIVRDANGQATGITGPYGHLTTLTFNADGLLQSLTTPANATYEMTYWSAAGLLKTFRTPRGLESTFAYDADGHLVQDANNAAFAWNLASNAETPSQRQITLTSAEGRASRYDVSLPAAGVQDRTVQDPLGVLTQYTETPTARELTGPLGTLQSIISEDPRFGAQAPYASSVRLTTPGGIEWSSTVEQAVTLTDVSCTPFGCNVDPFSIFSLKVDVTRNGNLGTVVYDGATRTATATTAEGRKAVATIDGTGRVTAEQLGTRMPVQYVYDARGRLSQVTQGARTALLTYNAEGFVDTLTDPLGRATAFQYDGVGRVTRQTLPDGRGIGFTYNADGDLNSLTPPGRMRHRFSRRLQGDIQCVSTPYACRGGASSDHLHLQSRPATHPRHASRRTGDPLPLRRHHRRSREDHDAAGQACCELESAERLAGISDHSGPLHRHPRL